MSQVGDALKRASEADRNRPRQPDTQGRLKPAADSGGPSLAVWAVLLLALALAGWFSWKWWKGNYPSASGKTAPFGAVAPKPGSSTGVDEADATSSSRAGSAPSRPATAAEVAWPSDLKLSGIIFSKTNPLALINGQPVGVGELIDGVRVTKITRDRVSVQWKGQVKELMIK
jgi:hypothetical protein